eukprot:8269033-Pyramimonas_sp.AAC.1
MNGWAMSACLGWYDFGFRMGDGATSYVIRNAEKKGVRSGMGGKSRATYAGQSRWRYACGAIGVAYSRCTVYVTAKGAN